MSDFDETEKHKRANLDWNKSAADNAQFSSSRMCCQFCNARISQEAIFCVHCNSHLISPSVESGSDDEYTDITYGPEGATFNHLGGRYVSYNDMRSSQKSSPPTKNYRCPQCRSDHIQSFAIAYRAGTGQGNFSGSGYSFEAGSVSVSGTSYHQTRLSALTSPPRPPQPFLLAIIVTFIVPFFSAMPLLITYQVRPFAFGLIILINIALIAAAYILCAVLAPPQWKKYRQKYAEWERAYICLRCGHSFYL